MFILPILSIKNGEAARKALFGDGTKAGGLIAEVLIGDSTKNLDGTPRANHKNPYDNIHTVLGALGIDKSTSKDHQNHFHIVLRTPNRVGITQNLLADNVTLDQTQTGVSEELRTAAQALLQQVQPHLSFEQGEIAMFVMDMPPDVPPQYAPVVIAQASQGQNPAKTDRTIGVCHLIENPPIPPGTAVNGLSPLGSVSDYFKRIEQRQLGLDGKVTVLQGPEHGTLEDEGGIYYGYHPTPDYYGPDRATVLVEIGGLKVKVLYFFNVMRGVPGGTEGYDPHDDKKYCPQGKGEMWKISLNPDDPNGSLITFQHPSQLTSTLAGIVQASLTLSLTKERVKESESQSVRELKDKTSQHLNTSKLPQSQLIKLSFFNANANPEIIAVDQQEGKVNYFIGNDPKKWRTNIPTYQAVVYKEIYKGIDLKFYGTNRQMEYDIIVKPGADPSNIKFSYEGVKELKVADNGDMEIVLNSPSPLAGEPASSADRGKGEGAKLIQKKPYIYQEINGKRVEVEGKFKILNSVQSLNFSTSELTCSEHQTPNSELSYTFQLASYNLSYSIIIDPILVYSTYLGGSGYDTGNGIAVDSSGNAYVTGDTTSTNFPTTAGAYDVASNGSNDVFVTKLNATGTALVYSIYLGGSFSDIGNGIAVDSSGNVYVTGYTYSTNFPITTGAYDTTCGGCSTYSDVFIAQLNSTGTALVYSTYLGGSFSDVGNGIAVDSSGNAYVTGYTTSVNFPATTGAYDTAFNGSYDVFITQLNSTGTALVYSTYLGGSVNDIGYGIAVDSAGNAYVTGVTSSTNFPTTIGAYYTASNGNYDAFVTKFNAAGTALNYSTYLGGSSYDYGYGIAVDSAGNAYVTGETSSTNFPTTNGAYDTASNGDYDAFVAKVGDVSGQYALAVTKSGSGTVTSNPVGINCGNDCYENYAANTVVSLTATPNTGYTFSGWSGDADCSDGVVTMNANKTCTATFNLTGGGGCTQCQWCCQNTSTGSCESYFTDCCNADPNEMTNRHCNNSDLGGGGGCGSAIIDSKKDNQPPASGMVVLLLLPILTFISWLIYRRVRGVLWPNWRM